MEKTIEEIAMSFQESERKMSESASARRMRSIQKTRRTVAARRAYENKEKA